MGQYHMLVNLDKREFVDPHTLGCGLKLWEQLANHPSTGSALIVLLACSNGRGGGDFDLEENWHGPERTLPGHNSTPGPMPEVYPEIAKRTIGRWAGNRIAIVGDYGDETDLAREDAGEIYRLCVSKETRKKYPKEFADIPEDAFYTDVSMDVCAVIEHELNGRFRGDGWREFERLDKAPEAATG